VRPETRKRYRQFPCLSDEALLGRASLCKGIIEDGKAKQNRGEQIILYEAMNTCRDILDVAMLQMQKWQHKFFGFTFADIIICQFRWNAFWPEHEYKLLSQRSHITARSEIWIQLLLHMHVIPIITIVAGWGINSVPKFLNAHRSRCHGPDVAGCSPHKLRPEGC